MPLTPESMIVREILAEYATNPRLRLFRRNVGLVTLTDGRRLRFAERGQADLYGWIVDPTLGAAHLEIEVKTPRGRMTDEQRAWRDMCLETGVIYVLARSAADVRDGLLDRGFVI